MSDRFPKGSEWHKWDLHIHTPKSIVQEYGGDTVDSWNSFIEKIAKLPEEIKAIAVTDYLFCDGYEYLLTRRNEIPNIDLIIPNIEFRLNTFSGTANNTKRHNFHVLFDPSVAVQDIREQLLNCLSTGYKIQDGTEWQQTPTVRSLEELGRQVKTAAPIGNTVHSKSDLEVGFDNITYKREDIEKQLSKTCFKGRFVTAIGYSEWDQAKWDQSAAEKRTLINSSNFALTCLDDPAKIAENREDLLKNKLNNIVLHSSDSHKIDRVGKSMLWIKADPTFAGLKQVLNEPEARVFIGTTPPNYKPDHKVISRISIPSSNGWFVEGFGLELNRDLVTIIGGRGSGKSALAEAIAYGAGSVDVTGDAFFKKAAKHQTPITGSKVLLDWADGTKTEFVVGDLRQDHELVRYLPQGAVEDLCSHKNSEKLQKQIENVIFQALDDTERMGSSDFEELQSRVLGTYQHEKDQVVKKVSDINKRIGSLLQVLKALPEKEKLLKEKNEELLKLKSSLPELPAEDKKGQEELAALSETKKKFETRIIELQEKMARIADVETRVKVFKTQILEFKQEISPLLTTIGVTDPSVFNIAVNENGIKQLLEASKGEVAGQLKTLREGSRADVAALLLVPLSDLPFDNLQSLNSGIEEKQKLTRAFETVKLKYQQQKKIALSIEGSIKALEMEVTKTKLESMPEKERLESERMSTYCSYFQLLAEEKKRIEELYKPLQASLSGGTDTDKKLVFEARISYQLDQHHKDGLEIIDRSRRGNFREANSLKNILDKLWAEYERQDFDVSILESHLSGILKSFREFEDGSISIEDQLREDYSEVHLYDWLFDPRYFNIVSSLKFDGADLYVLSPGQKGIILLMLYLEIDKEDYRPLIIDQPEENLDSLSIYTDLIHYFRERKQYRQIIMVTHNPNLVVNTDSEQVIVANYSGTRSPRLEYRSGSLENQAKEIPSVALVDLEDGIIEQVCNILEGGEKAFEKRKKKYQISLKSQI